MRTPCSARKGFGFFVRSELGFGEFIVQECWLVWRLKNALTAGLWVSGKLGSKVSDRVHDNGASPDLIQPPGIHHPAYARRYTLIVNNDQLDFAFVADLPTQPAAVTKKKAPAGAAKRGRVDGLCAAPLATPVGAPPVSVPVALAPSVSPALLTNPEAMAQALESHPDYRVLRRLVPVLQWPGSVPQRVCKVVVLDTETTGLDSNKEKVIELALLRCDVDMDTGRPVGEVRVYDGLEDPGIPIPKEIEKITGISQSMVMGQRIDEAKVAELLRGVDVVIAHNAAFDRPFVEARLPSFSQLAWACSFAEIAWKEQGRSSSKLENLSLANGYFYDAHRAEMDCHALLSVLAAPLPVESPLGPTGLACLIANSKAPSFRVQATHAPFDAKDKLKARGYRWHAEQKVWHTRLGTNEALQAECRWLKDNVYSGRGVVIQIEKLDAQARYSNRPGETLYQQL